MPRAKKSKYKKIYMEEWKCRGCDFAWCYKAFRCPLCASMEVIKIL